LVLIPQRGDQTFCFRRGAMSTVEGPYLGKGYGQCHGVFRPRKMTAQGSHPKGREVVSDDLA